MYPIAKECFFAQTTPTKTWKSGPWSRFTFHFMSAGWKVQAHLNHPPLTDQGQTTLPRFDWFVAELLISRVWRHSSKTILDLSRSRSLVIRCHQPNRCGSCAHICCRRVKAVSAQIPVILATCHFFTGQFMLLVTGQVSGSGVAIESFWFF